MPLPDESSATSVTQADQLEPMGVERVAHGRAHLVGTVLQRGLEVRWQRDVVDAAALRAHQVVVVAHELLVEFVACDVVDRGETANDPALLEGGEIAVQGRLCLPRPGVHELGDGHGATEFDEQVHEIAACGGVALPSLVEALGNGPVDLGMGIGGGHAHQCIRRSHGFRELVSGSPKSNQLRASRCPTSRVTATRKKMRTDASAMEADPAVSKW